MTQETDPYAGTKKGNKKQARASTKGRLWRAKNGIGDANSTAQERKVEEDKIEKEKD